MTQEEYNRLREYEKIDSDIQTLKNAIFVAEDSPIAYWDNETKYSIIMRAIFLCKDSLADMFRSKMFEMERERDKI